MTQPDYSTTRNLTTIKPECFDSRTEGLTTLLKTPDNEHKIAEGGLRLKGLYKSSSEEKPLITVVTVVYNGAEYLEDTIKSVIGQTYGNVEYIIVDGGSNDATLEIIKKYEDAIDYWVSEPDKGMYDGLAKGFQFATGNFMCYLNAGDLYTKTALSAVISIFLDTGCDWLTGMRSVCNDLNQIIRVDLPFRYKSNLIRKGVYGKYLPYIQQESTFWSRDLLVNIDLEFFKSLRYAGDYYLWFCFSEVTTLRISQVQLGIFKRHAGQLSESLDKYWDEVNSFSKRINMVDFIGVLIELPQWIFDSELNKRKNRILFHDGKWS